MRRYKLQRSVEVLEQKRMNAANLLANAVTALPATSNTVQTTVSGAATASAANAAHLTASLSGSGQGTVNLVSGLSNGSARANFLVHVSGAPANQTFDVSVGGTVVGSISTNAHGNGTLHLNSALNNAAQVLTVLPTLGADASVSIGVSGQTPLLTGTLQAAANAGASVSGVSVSGATSGISGALGAASNLENTVIPKLNSVIDKVDSLAANAVDNLMTVTDKLDNVANRLVDRVDNLVAAVVDKVFSAVDSSALLGNVRSLLPSDLTNLI
jgi:hypothetical protein